MLDAKYQISSNNLIALSYKYIGQRHSQCSHNENVLFF